MYIPSSFFSSQGACISASASAIAGNGIITTGSFVSQSISWSYVQFETLDYTDPSYTAFTASLNIFSGSTGQAKLLIVGAGGAGGSGNNVIGRPASDFTAGGGGGGGVVYYNNFPLSSGSFEIGVGGATTQISLEATGSNGRNSYIKLPNNITYTPFDTSFLTAYGGGGGGFGKLDTVNPFNICYSFYGTAGPTTGGIGIYTSQCGSRNAANTIYTTLNGIIQGPQGFKGGDITAGAGGNFAATGGGGAASVGVSLTANDLNFGILASNGGDGLQFNMTGTPTYYSPGGGGQGGNDTGTFGLGGNTYGRGGQGERDGNTTQINFGFGGVVIIAWPICLYTASVIPIPPEPAPTFPGIEYLVLGGGGGGGAATGNGADYTTYYSSGGGGAGALITGSMTLSTGSTYPIVIGNGGNGTIPNTISASNGSTTTAFGLTAIGGGFGGASNQSGSNGGSGGGAGGAHSQAVSGGIGVAGQGNNGGTNNTSIGTFIKTSGGGGGASEVGHPYTGTNPGYGGSGSAWLNGITYAAGGGAGGDNTSYGLGGSGIGGNGQYGFVNPATTGSENRGSGGGGGCYTGGVNIAVGASGSAGVVVIRYDGTTPQATGGTITISGSCVYHTFTGSANLIT